MLSRQFRILYIGYSEVYDGLHAYLKRTEFQPEPKSTGKKSQIIFPSAQGAKDKLDMALSQRGIGLYGINKIVDIENADYILMSGASEGWISWWKYIHKCGKLYKTIYVAAESDAINPYNGKEKLANVVAKCFPIVLSWPDLLKVDNVVNMKLSCSDFEYNGSPISFSDKKLLTMIIRNRKKMDGTLEMTKERMKAIHYFDDKPGVFDLYGKGWGNNQQIYCGVVTDKRDAYAKYKFAICFENSRSEGYISEKIFDCFVSGIVPIYAGARNVTQYIPEGCFIDYFKYSD